MKLFPTAGDVHQRQPCCKALDGYALIYKDIQVSALLRCK